MKTSSGKEKSCFFILVRHKSDTRKQGTFRSQTMAQQKLNGPEPNRVWLGASIQDRPVLEYLPTRLDLFPRYFGTVLSMIKTQLLSYTIITVIFYGLYASSLTEEPCTDDGLKCRPQWVDENIASISYTTRILTRITSFLLVTYLWQAFGNYQR